MAASEDISSSPPQPSEDLPGDQARPTIGPPQPHPETTRARRRERWQRRREPTSSGGESDFWRRERETPQRSEHGDSEDWGTFERFRQFRQTYQSRGHEENDYDQEQERTNAGAPPSWDGTTNFQDYLLRARLWAGTTRAPARTRGPLLLKALVDTPWEDFKYLARDSDWPADHNNAEVLLAKMDTKDYYGEEQRENMLSAFARITFHLRRTKGEAARSFLSKWDNADRKVRDHKVSLPDEYLGFLLITSLQLDSEQIKLLLNFTKGSISTKDVKEWLRTHETNLNLNHLGKDGKDTKKVNATLLTETEILQTEETEEDGEEPALDVLMAALGELSPGENEEEPDATFDEDEAKEILVTMVKNATKQTKVRKNFMDSMKAKKNRDLARGFGAGRDGSIRPGTYKVSIEELKKRTRCRRCDKTGHWSRECPERKRLLPGNDGAKETLWMDTSDEADFLTEACHYMEYLDFENGQNHECHVLESHQEKERTKEAAKSLLESAIRVQQEERGSPSKAWKST